MSKEPPPTGSREELLAFAAENLHMAGIQASLGVTYAEIGDAAGLEYATRRLVAYVKAVIPTVKDLRPATAKADAA